MSVLAPGEGDERLVHALARFADLAPDLLAITDLDGRVQWRFMDHFAADLEGALLFPGAALQDRDGNAVRSGMVQARTTFFF